MQRTSFERNFHIWKTVHWAVILGLASKLFYESFLIFTAFRRIRTHLITRSGGMSRANHSLCLKELLLVDWAIFNFKVFQCIFDSLNKFFVFHGWLLSPTISFKEIWAGFFHGGKFFRAETRISELFMLFNYVVYRYFQVLSSTYSNIIVVLRWWGDRLSMVDSGYIESLIRFHIHLWWLTGDHLIISILSQLR